MLLVGEHVKLSMARHEELAVGGDRERIGPQLAVDLAAGVEDEPQARGHAEDHQPGNQVLEGFRAGFIHARGRLVAEVAHAGEDHRQAVLVGRGDHLVVADAAARLDNRHRAIVGDDVEPVTKWKECI